MLLLLRQDSLLLLLNRHRSKGRAMSCAPFICASSRAMGVQLAAAVCS
jgi:hypothetical protein